MNYSVTTRSTAGEGIRTKSDRPRQDPGEAYRSHVNPQWVRLLETLGMNAEYTKCQGIELFTSKGKRVLDFLSGYCVYNTGHNHPDIVSEVEEELRSSGPMMLQSHAPDLAGQLASRLCELAGGRAEKVFFTSSGSEGVETVIKFARAHTARPGILYCDGAFHGLTNGALSLMGDPMWREQFGPLLPGTEAVPFDDLEALETKLATKEFAAFLVEPVQSEAGIRVPRRDYLAGAQELCRKYGTLFAIDEVQTGLFRTGPFLASQHFGVEPDIVVLAKALSGGLVPVGAVLMSDAVHRSVFDSLSHACVHASTFGENNLAMRAGLATLRVLEEGRLGERAERLGIRLQETLRERLLHFEMVENVRGMGLLQGIVFRAPRRLRLQMLFAGFARVHSGMFGQMVVSQLYRREGIMTQMCGNNHMVLKAAPPLVSSEQDLDFFVGAVENVLERVHDGGSFWTDALSMARRATGI